MNMKVSDIKKAMNDVIKNAKKRQKDAYSGAFQCSDGLWYVTDSYSVIRSYDLPEGVDMLLTANPEKYKDAHKTVMQVCRDNLKFFLSDSQDKTELWMMTVQELDENVKKLKKKWKAENEKTKCPRICYSFGGGHYVDTKLLRPCLLATDAEKAYVDKKNIYSPLMMSGDRSGTYMTFALVWPVYSKIERPMGEYFFA